MDFLMAQQTASFVGEVLKVASTRMELKHREEMARLQVLFAKAIIDGVVSRKIDVIQRQCDQAMEIFKQQSDEYMAERRQLSQEREQATRRIKRSDIAAQIADVDACLREIRADAQLAADKLRLSLESVGFGNLTFHVPSLPALL